MKTVKLYVLPFILALLMLIALGIWANHEMKYARQQALNHMHETSIAVLKSFEGSIRSQVHRGRSATPRLQAILENVVESTGVIFVQVRLQNVTAVSAGEIPVLPEVKPGTVGQQFTSDIFVIWESVRLGECPMQERGKGRRHHGFDREMDLGDLNFGNQEQTLIIGVSDKPYRQTIFEAKKRLQFSGGVGAFAVLVVLGAWCLALRNRFLKESLAATRARSSHLEDLGLSAAGLAHETKNPLGIIRGLAQRIHKEDISPEQIKAISESIMNEVDTASVRLGRFMTYAKSMTPKVRPVMADEFLKHIAGLLQPDCDAAGVKLITRAEPSAIMADKDMLQQVLVNLLLNSLKASTRGSEIEVEIKHVGNKALLTVSDQGAGIPGELISSIFKPYTSGHADGHGMGLAIVKRIVEDHGWEIDLDSEPGSETRFTISQITVSKKGIKL
jgi:two-component system sensor histidine kinase HydH